MILAVLHDHFVPKPPELARCYEFCRRDQAPVSLPPPTLLAFEPRYTAAVTMTLTPHYGTIVQGCATVLQCDSRSGYRMM